MNKNLDSRAPAVPARPRGLRVVALLNTSALLVTSTPVATAEPKLPPYVGD